MPNFLYNSEMPSRREFLEVLIPGGWALEAAKNKSFDLSGAGKASLVKDILLVPALAAACSAPPSRPGASPQASPRPDNSAFPEGALVPDAKTRMIDEINRLPESSIKRALIERALPYFQKPGPFVLNRSGLELKVYSFSVKARKTRQTDTTSGTFIFHEITTPPEKKDQLHATEAASGRQLAIPNLIREDEVPQLPRPLVGPDNRTFLPQFNITQGAFIAGGVYPEITITTPYQELLAPEDRTFHAESEHFAYIKEACSLMFADIFLEEIFLKTRELGFPTTVKVADGQGNTKDVELISGYWSILMALDNKDTTGRIKAALDLAGYLISLKALERTANLEVLKKDSNYLPTLQLLPNINLGDTPHSIWQKALEAVLSHPELLSLDHKGDLSRLP